MLDVRIIGLLFKEEFRLQASFFNRSYFLASSLVLILFTFILGLSLPMLRLALAVEDMLLVAHWIILFYGLGVGGFALLGERILERRFGSISLLLGSGYTLPIRHRRLFMLFYTKDALYYIFFTILPMIIGLAGASFFVQIKLTSLLFLFFSLTLSFLLGISVTVMLLILLVRWGIMALLVVSAIAGIFVVSAGIPVDEIIMVFPPLVFYYSRSLSLTIEVLTAVLLFAAISFFFVKEVPAPHERTATAAYEKITRITSKIIPGYGPLLAKDIIDMIRSGMIFPVIFTFLMPLLFLVAVLWFIESVLLLDLMFSLLFYAVMVGFFCTLLYSWLSNIDISESYNSLPISMPHVIRTKLILFFILTVIVAIPYLAGVGYLKGELELLWISLIIMSTVSIYVGSVTAYLTGPFTNSYLLDARILALFASYVVPVLVVETLLSFYYTLNNIVAIFCIAGLGLLLLAVSIMILNRLEDKWKGNMFRIV